MLADLPWHAGNRVPNRKRTNDGQLFPTLSVRAEIHLPERCFRPQTSSRGFYACADTLDAGIAWHIRPWVRKELIIKLLQGMEMRFSPWGIVSGCGQHSLTECRTVAPGKGSLLFELMRKERRLWANIWEARGTGDHDEGVSADCTATTYLW